MKNFIIGLFLIVSPFFSFAHNPLSAKYHLEAGEQVSLLSINLSQAGVNQALLKKYGKKKLKALTQNEFKAMIVDYIKSNFKLSIDKKEIKLTEGGVKLGSHQTDLKFVLPPISKETEQIGIHIPAFRENDHHQTIFSYNLHGSPDHIILSAENDFQSTITSSTPEYSNAWRWLIWVGIVSLILIISLKITGGTKVPMLSIVKN